MPVIANIHRRVLEAITADPDTFDMSQWHGKTACKTTHCRAGYVTFLAGEAGRKLEEQTSTLHAAMQIYHASSPDIQVSPPRFFEPNAIALADIKRCAAEEAQEIKQG